MKTLLILLSMASALTLQATEQVSVSASASTKKTITSISTVSTQDAAPQVETPNTVQNVAQVGTPLVAVFFTARSVSDHIRHDARITQHASASTAKAAAEQGVITDTGVASSASTEESTSATAGQKTTYKSDEVAYVLDNASREEFGTALFDVFAANGFDDIVDGAFFDESALLDEAYGQGDVVPASIWRKIVSSLRTTDPSIEYLVVGTLDFGIPAVDPALNLWAVDATVSGRIYRLSNGVPRLVAALAPQTHKARAKDQLQSKKRALDGISELAAEEIITKLKAKGILP